MNNEYIISTCSTADVTKEFFEKRDIHYVCFHFEVDGKQYPDDLGVSFPLPDFYQAMRDGAMTKTSQVSTGEYIQYFEKFLQEGKDVLHLCLSSGISGTVNSAVLAANDLKEKYPDEFVVAGQLGTYYVIWNVNEDILPAGSELEGEEAELAKAEIRNAVSLLFDRNYICEEIGQAGQVPASSFVAMGLTDAGGEGEFYENAGHSDDYVGYYDVSQDALESNYTEAMEVLKKYYTLDESTGMFTDFPTLTYLYNTSEGHKAIGEYLQSALAGVGITMNLENQEWNTFLETRKNGDYSIARNGWLGDYNDPISFLDMWTTGSGNNDAQFGRDAHKSAAIYSLDLTDLGYDDIKVENGTWADTYDVLISTIKTCTDDTTRYELMHRAEDLLMSTGAICPLYYYTDPYMLDSSVKGFFANPLGYKYFMYTTIEE